MTLVDTYALTVHSPHRGSQEGELPWALLGEHWAARLSGEQASVHLAQAERKRWAPCPRA